MSDVTCRGSFALGTACGRCSRCRREIESYNAMKSVRDKLNTPSSAISRIEELEAKLAKAVDALKFYAEADNYEDQHKPESCGCCYYLHDAEIKEDQGAKARTALAELTGGKDE